MGMIFYSVLGPGHNPTPWHSASFFWPMLQHGHSIRKSGKPLLDSPGVCYRFLNMSDTPPTHDDFIHSEEFLDGLMRRQLRLSIACAGAFLLVLVGLPLANYFAPDFMGQRVGGFTLTWLVLGVLFFPFVWIIARLFITRSMAMEEAEVVRAAEGNQKRRA
jgi:uncharacterized membrane protein (DUF485 family)